VDPSHQSVLLDRPVRQDPVFRRHSN
jgi:hypothetical protein